MKKTVYGQNKYYSNELEDDFSDIPVKTKDIDESHVYLVKNFWGRLGSWLLLNLIAIPLLYIFAKYKYDFKIIGRIHIKKIKGPFILYGNHSAQFDAIIPQAVINRYRRKTYIVSDPSAASIPYIRHITKALGALPLASTYKGKVNFLKAIGEIFAKGHCLAIYPEAHIWPYSTTIRPYTNASFHYAVKYKVPLIPMVATYRYPRGLFKAYKKPRMIINLGAPLYPDFSLSESEAKQKLWEYTYTFMKKYADDINNVALYNYLKLEK